MLTVTHVTGTTIIRMNQLLPKMTHPTRLRLKTIPAMKPAMMAIAGSSQSRERISPSILPQQQQRSGPMAHWHRVGPRFLAQKRRMHQGDNHMSPCAQ